MLIDALAASGCLPWSKAFDLAGTRAALDTQIDEALALGLPLVRQADGLFWRPDVRALRVEAIARELALAGHACPLACRVLVDSTNTRLMVAAASGDRGPRILAAECQLAGRGRRERRWQASYGEAMLFSALIDIDRPLRELPGLAIATGVGLAKALESMDIDGISLKWPNDVLRAGAKLGGILVEAPGGSTAAGVCVVGIGINWQLSPRSREQIGRPVADLSQPPRQTARDRSQVIGRLMAAVLETAITFRMHGLSGFLDDFARLDGILGKPVAIESGTQSRDGIARGIDEDGSLRVLHIDGERRYQSAEVSVRVP
jgi:BirA family biotin operon repressor/biotin-[acetyl-CoA-carboxylase] ligase